MAKRLLFIVTANNPRFTSFGIRTFVIYPQDVISIMQHKCLIKKHSIMKKFTLLAAIVIMAASCAPQRTLYREASGRNIEPAQSGVITPFIADLEMLSDTKQTYVETTDYEVTMEVIRNIESFKKMALLNAAKKFNADTMVAALINVDTTDKGLLTITVTGYPAKYVNFRNMTEKDVWIQRVSGKCDIVSPEHVHAYQQALIDILRLRK